MYLPMESALSSALKVETVTIAPLDIEIIGGYVVDSDDARARGDALKAVAVDRLIERGEKVDAAMRWYEQEQDENFKEVPRKETLVLELEREAIALKAFKRYSLSAVPDTEEMATI